MTIDSHSHLTSPPLSNEVPAVIERAKKVGVHTIITVGSGEIEEGNSKAIELAKKFPNTILATVGIHPHDAAKVKDGWEDRLTEIASKGAVAIGEAGLDYHYMNSPKKNQIDVFKKQIRLAQILDLAIIFHVREASDDFWKIINECGLPRKGAVWHCFSGTLDDLKKAVNLGMFISFAGPITYPKANELRLSAMECPLEQILIETDAPYLAPQGFRGKTNEPSFVIEVLKKIAELRDLELDEAEAIIDNNTKEAFSLPGANRKPSIAYKLGNSLYLSITNHCRLACTFCHKHKNPRLRCYNLKLDHEPTVEEILHNIDDPTKYDEIVFCGFGEPTTRLDIIKEVSKKLRCLGAKSIRINTDGLANLAEKKDVTADLKNYIDSISISLNAHDAKTYSKICPSKYGTEAFDAVLDFIKYSVKNIPNVQVTALTLPEVDIKQCKKLVDGLGAKFKERIYQRVG